MAENLLILAMLVLNVAAALFIVRIAWRVFRGFVRGTGKAWRGETDGL